MALVTKLIHLASSTQKNWQLMLALLRDLFCYKPYKMTLTLLLMLFRSLTAGVGLLLILPLLQVIGFSLGSDKTSGLTKLIITVFQTLHLPLNLVTILISLCVVMTSIAIAAYAEQIISIRLQQNYIHYLRSQLYKNILSAKWSFLLQQKTASLVYALTTQIQKIGFANFQLLSLVNHIILLSVFTMLAFLLSWQITLIAVFCALLMLSLLLPLHKQTTQLGNQQLRYNQAIMQALTEQLNALKMIKGSGFEKKFVDETKRISSVLEIEHRHFTETTAATKLLYSISSVILFSLFLYCAIQIMNLGVKNLMLLLLVFSRILPMVSTMQQSYQRILHELASYSTMQTLVKQCKAQQEPLNPYKELEFNEAISLQDISFSYQPKLRLPVIRHLSITIKKNTSTILVGPSGIGKSTLADLMIGLLEPTEGNIYIDGKCLDSQYRIAWRRSVAYVTQESYFFNDSIRHNLQLLCEEPQTDGDLWKVLETVAAKDFVMALPQGLDTIIGDRGLRLSGGERQRIALARALLSKPKFLVLDESTNALDKQAIDTIQTALHQLHGKITLLIISHQEEMCRFADQKIILSNHKVVEAL